jgi:hypothetical protein
LKKKSCWQFYEHGEKRVISSCQISEPCFCKKQIWSKQYRRMLNFLFYLILKICLMDDHDFSYFIILNNKTHTFTHSLTHLEATPINLNQISYGGKKKEKKEK